MLTKSKPVHTPIKLTRFITALHEMQTRGIAMRKLSVCPSVRLSVKRENCDKTEERSVHTKDHLA